MERKIMLEVKRKMRQLNFTQEQLAKELKVSLPTAKRWLAGRGVNLIILRKISEFLGCSFSELILSAEDHTLESYTYTLEQEKVLSQEPKLLAFLDLLISGKSVAAISSRYNLSSEHVTKMILKLDKIGLLEAHPKERVKLLIHGEPQWIRGGPLSKKFRSVMIEDFLGHHEKEGVHFFAHDYLPHDIQTIEGKIRDIKEFLVAANHRAVMSRKEAVSSAFYLKFGKYEWNLRDELR